MGAELSKGLGGCGLKVASGIKSSKSLSSLGMLVLVEGFLRGSARLPAGWSTGVNENVGGTGTGGFCPGRRVRGILADGGAGLQLREIDVCVQNGHQGQRIATWMVNYYSREQRKRTDRKRMSVVQVIAEVVRRDLEWV